MLCFGMSLVADEDRNNIIVIRNEKCSIRCVRAFNPVAELIALVGGGNFLRIWKQEKNKVTCSCLPELKDPKIPAFGIGTATAFSPDSKLVAGGYVDGLVTVGMF